MGGIVLHEGDIAEMKTGEGKTFVAVQPLYLNGLTGRGVHLVTVNDYLAKRDAEWTRPVYEKLGSTVGFIQNLMPFAERRVAYANDVTYGTNSEFGFDYLSDNMAVSLEGTVQRSHAYAIVDEVDSILDRRGANAAHHLRRARDRCRRRTTSSLEWRRPSRAWPRRASRRRARTRPRPRAPTTSTTRSSRPSRPRRPRSRRSSARSASTTCTTRATSSSSTT